MTWEETIAMIRKEAIYEDLVRLAYFEEDLPLNIHRFGKSDEFTETLNIINEYRPGAENILDIGSGNGISAINFSLQGFKVSAVEPDPSNTVGAGAIRKLKEHFQIKSLMIYESLAEDINFPASTFDVVYIRQAMHHANDLNKFLTEAVRVLKPNGLLLTVRDHVIYNEKDKEWFLREHPLHRYYGGENAYKAETYRDAISSAGGEIKKELKHFDSVINYFPISVEEIDRMKTEYLKRCKSNLRNKIGILANVPIVFWLYRNFKKIRPNNALDETKVPGRMYSYIVLKR